MTNAALKNDITELDPRLGMQAAQRRDIAEKLGDALADAFRLNFNLLGLHWNVEGPTFYSVHKLTEDQYTTVGKAVDELAERIRALGLPAPQSLIELANRSPIDDLPTSGPLKERIDRLVADFEQAGIRLKDIVSAAEEVNDIKTADLLTDLTGTYEEYAWMLRATTA